MVAFNTPKEAVKTIIELFCAERGLTQVNQGEFAKALGASQPTVSVYLSGYREPGKAMTIRLCELVDNQIQPYQVRPDLFLHPGASEQRKQQILESAGVA